VQFTTRLIELGKEHENSEAGQPGQQP
jgi:hypothetical protein